MAIKTLDEFLATIPAVENRQRMVEVLDWVQQQYPELELRLAWNQPMFTHHGTFIIGFSVAAKHIAMAPEQATMAHFAPVLEERGADYGKMLVRQPWNQPFDFDLAAMFIDYQLATKAAVTSFWRPKAAE
ncbi:MAG: DUF1801 domain-containing protein [Trueperella sp.]|nr:DUF1801 domain-containing protein [Trueperella sp.]